jgi:hypothetical protein
MTFERRETFLGVPFSKWTNVPKGIREERFTGAEHFFGIRQQRILGVKVVTNLAEDGSQLAVDTTTQIADSWTTFSETPSKHILPKGSSEKVRVFAATPSHQVIYRWNGKK